MERCPHTCAKLHLCILKKKCLMRGLIIADVGLYGHSHSTENSSVAPLSQELLLPLSYSQSQPPPTGTSCWTQMSAVLADSTRNCTKTLDTVGNLSLWCFFFQHIAKHLARHSRHTEVRCPISWQHGQLWYTVQGRNNFMKPTPTTVMFRAAKAAFVQRDFFVRQLNTSPFFFVWQCGPSRPLDVDAGSLM